MISRSDGGGRWLAQQDQEPLDGAVVCLARPEDGVAPFLRWPATFRDAASGAPVRLCAARYPGERDPHWWREFPSIEEQGRDLALELAARTAHGITLFGHGVSALVVYEAADELARLGVGAVARLVVSDCPPPSGAEPATPMPSQDELLERTLMASLERGDSPLLTQVEQTLRAVRAQTEAARGYRRVRPAGIGLPLCVLSWRAGESREAMAEWARCGPARFFEIDLPSTHFVRAHTEVLPILAGDYPERESEL